MKTVIALLCILFIGIGTVSATATPDASPDKVVCVDYLTPDVVVADINSVYEHPSYDPVSIDCTTIAPDANCIACLPDCSDPVPLDSSPDEPDSNYITTDISTLNASLKTGDPVRLKQYPTASDFGNPCVTNTKNWNGDPTAGKSAECSPDNGANVDHLNTIITEPKVAKPCGS